MPRGMGRGLVVEKCREGRNGSSRAHDAQSSGGVRLLDVVGIGSKDPKEILFFVGIHRE